MWVPSDEWIENSNVYKHMRKHGMGDYGEFLQRSFYDYEWFWSSFFEEVNFVWFEKYTGFWILRRGNLGLSGLWVGS